MARFLHRHDARRVEPGIPQDPEPRKESPMKLRHLAAWFSGMALLGTGATFLGAQTPQPLREGPGPARIDPGKLRAEVIKLRTEVETLRFDYDLARNTLLEDVKTEKALWMAGGLMGAVSEIQAAIIEPGAKHPAAAPRQATEQDRKKEAEAAKAEEQFEKKLAEAIADRKKELARKYALLAAKQLDLEDAERNYRAIAR
jgi:hypothetical protein